MQTITREQIQNQISAGANLAIIDARGAEKFAQGHLPGAVNIPVADIKTKAAQLLGDKNQQIVTYCSGTACTAAGAAADELAALGYKNVSAYTGGKQDWKDAGLKLEGEACTGGSCSTTKTGTCG